ncbi:LTA synthase family protein [Dyella sp. KULCS107]|uniref:LTA synthase family protein n=1 Tax=Dyella sp. KULCS107 TaxID=3422216 RepID=UPI003D6E6634
MSLNSFEGGAAFLRGAKRLAWIALLCLVLLQLAWMADRQSIGVALDSYAFTYGYVVNAIPAIAVFLFLLALCNRIVLSTALSAALLGAIYAANALKLRYLHTPVLFSDVYILRNMHVATLELLANYVGGWYAATAVLVALVALIVWAIRRETSYFPPRSFSRLAIALASLASMYGLGAGAGWVGRVYNANALRVVAWAPMDSILHSGLLSSIAYTSAERIRALKVPVDTAAVKELRSLPSPPAAAPLTVGTTPDIVVIQSESFFDTSILKNVGSTDAELPNLKRALATGLGGTMKPPTFGGGTLRTEFEVLTGIPMAAYPDIGFPYLQITKPKIPSLVRVARNAGYATVAIHGNAGNFWNRAKAFKSIGFDQFVTAAEFPKNAAREGWYFADSAMTDQIMAKLQDATKPTLVFAISIEGHGPYMKVPVGDPHRRDAIAAPEGLGSKGIREYRNYMYHIEDADQQLGRLWSFLEARKRPYILVFYGDHLPGLQHVYDSGFDNGQSGPDQFVPWFIVGDRSTQTTKHIYSWMLGGEILGAAGIRPPLYYQLTGKAEQQLADPGQAEAATEGIYSAARLYLNGRLRDGTKQAR